MVTGYPWMTIENLHHFNPKAWLLFVDNLKNVEVKVAMLVEQLDSESSLCAYDPQPYTATVSRRVVCERLIVGQYVRLQMMIDYADYLQFSEMQVHGF